MKKPKSDVAYTTARYAIRSGPKQFAAYVNGKFMIFALIELATSLFDRYSYCLYTIIKFILLKIVYK